MRRWSRFVVPGGHYSESFRTLPPLEVGDNCRRFCRLLYRVLPPGQPIPVPLEFVGFLELTSAGDRGACRNVHECQPRGGVEGVPVRSETAEWECLSRGVPFSCKDGKGRALALALASSDPDAARRAEGATGEAVGDDAARGADRIPAFSGVVEGAAEVGLEEGVLSATRGRTRGEGKSKKGHGYPAGKWAGVVSYDSRCCPLGSV